MLEWNCAEETQNPHLPTVVAYSQPKKQMLNAILMVHKYSPLNATQFSLESLNLCPHQEVPWHPRVQSCCVYSCFSWKRIWAYTVSGLEGVGSGLEEAGGSGLGLTSSSSAYVRLSSCDTRGWKREGKSERNLKECSLQIRQKKWTYTFQKKDG